MALQWTPEQLEAFRNGDNTIYRILFDEYAGPLYALANELLNDTEEAKDIVSTAFEKLLEKKADLQSFDHIRNFLFRVAKTRSFNILKSRGNQPVSLDNLYDEFAGNVTFIDETQLTILQQLQEEHVLAALDRLSPRQRECLRKRYLEKWTVKAIAEHLKISQFTVYKHLRKGREEIDRKFNNGDGPRLNPLIIFLLIHYFLKYLPLSLAIFPGPL